MDRIALATAENERVNALTGVFNPKTEMKAASIADLAQVRERWARMDSIPFHLENRDAAIDNGFLGMDVRTFLTGDDSSGRLSVHDILVPPGGGLAAHWLEDCDMFLHVIEGSASLTVGTLSQVCEPGTFGYVPADTTFAVSNESTAATRLLCIFNPAGIELGFADAHDHWVRTGDTRPESYREILGRYGFRFDVTGPRPYDARVNLPLDRMDVRVESIEDFQDMRAQWAQRPPVPRLLLDRSDCYNLSLVDGATRAEASVVLGGEDTRGRGVFFYADQYSGYSAPPHFQPSEEEIFFVLEGQINLRCGNRTEAVRQGGFAFAPRGASHGFTNPGPGVARLVTLNSPAGHERGFERMMEYMDGAHEVDGLMNLMLNHGWITHSNDGWGAEGTQAEDYVNSFELP